MKQLVTNSDEIFHLLSENTLKYAFEAIVSSGSKDPHGDRKMNIFLLLTAALLAYAGVEAANLLLRNNFGKKGVNRFRLVLSVTGFGVISYLSFSYYRMENFNMNEYGFKSSFLVTSIVYLVLALMILSKGVSALGGRNKSIHESYRGDSSLLRFMIDKSTQQSWVQNVAEPLFLIAVGAFLSPINLLLGVPLIFCGISSWLHLAMESIVKFLKYRDELSNAGYKFNQSTQFSSATN